MSSPYLMMPSSIIKSFSPKSYLSIPMAEINLDKILITGSGGMVGSYIDFGIKTNKEILDITDFDAVQKFVADTNPRAILHLAAETDMGACEENPERAYFINSIGTYNVACAAKQAGAKMVYVSTNAVFDRLDNGPFRESDTPFAKSVYGKSKHMGELAVRGISDDYFIILTSWIFGGGPTRDKKFVRKIIDQLSREGTKEIRAASDQIGSPTFGKDVVGAIKALLGKGAVGVFHIVNSGSASRLEMAEEIIKTLGSNANAIPVDISFFNPDATGGDESLLSLKYPMRPWQEALKEYLESEWREADVFLQK